MDNARIADSLTTGLGLDQWRRWRSRSSTRRRTALPSSTARSRRHVRSGARAESGVFYAPAARPLQLRAGLDGHGLRPASADSGRPYGAGQADARSQLHHGRGASAGPPRCPKAVAGHPLRSAQGLPGRADLILNWMTAVAGDAVQRGRGRHPVGIELATQGPGPPGMRGAPRSRCWSRSRR